MIFKIELETVLDRIKKQFSIDTLRDRLDVITRFFESIKYPKVSHMRSWERTDILSSDRYNMFLRSIARDMEIIYDTQKKIKRGSLTNWNLIEQMKFDKEDEPVDYYDKEFITDLPRASEFVNVTLSVAGSLNRTPHLKDDPQVKASTNREDVEPYFGKLRGLWIEDDITSEDGIRPQTFDTSTMIDGEDTFYEIEATVLQAPMQRVHYDQKVIDGEIVLTSEVKFVFDSPTFVNYVNVRPFTFASGIYFDLMDIVVSDGRRQASVGIRPVRMDAEKTVTFTPPFDRITSLNMKFRQTEGYFMKYSVVGVDFDDVFYKVDVTGLRLMENIEKYENPVSYIKHRIRELPYWIMSVVYDDVILDDLPKIDTDFGDDGFLTIESDMSRRKRWAIGIEDIEIGENTYSSSSEIVTRRISLPENTWEIKLDVTDNEIGTIKYYISFDDGLSWVRVRPVGSEIIYDNGHVVPGVLYLNSDISIERKRADDEGELAFIDTSTQYIRAKAVLLKENDEVPELIRMRPVFV